MGHSAAIAVLTWSDRPDHLLERPRRSDEQWGEFISSDGGFVGHQSDPLTLEMLCSWLTD